MAYPKRTENEKREFIAKVLNLLDSKGETRKYSHLENIFDLEKQYQVAQRYVREMGLSFDEVSKAPNSDFEIAAASEDDYIEESEEKGDFTEETEEDEDAEDTEDSDFTLNSMTAEEVQEHLQNHASRSPYKRKQQNTIKQRKRERKKELFGRYNEILECLQDIDEGVFRGDYAQAKRMIGILDDYADRLHNLLDRVYVERAEKILKQLAELESVLGHEEIQKIREGIVYAAAHE